MKVIIAGGRDFDDYERLKDEVDYFIYKNGIYFIEKPIIVSGGAKGADSLGEKYAKEKGYELICMHAEWGKYGLYAGNKRNEDMAKMADACICFWDGLSKGTQDMIRLSNKYNLYSKVIYYTKRKDGNG